MPKFNPDMLTLARESRGMTQAELASVLSVKQGTMSKYETGLLEIPEADLAKIAAALDYHKSLFYQDEQTCGLGMSTIFHRRRRRIPARVLKCIEAEVNIRRLQIKRLLLSAEVSAANRFERLDVDAFDGNPETVADHVRLAWRLPTGPILNLAASTESAGGIVVACDFSTRRIDAVHIWHDGEPPMFFVNRNSPTDRLRFTLAHEIGHAVMHAFPTEAMEDEANKFAAELLMPADEIKSHLHEITIERAAALKPHWKVSMQALIVRARTLGCIPESRYRRLFASLGALGYRVTEPVALPPDEPSVFSQLLAIHKQELEYSDDDIAELMLTYDPDYYPPEHAPVTLRVGSKRVLRLPRQAT